MSFLFSSDINLSQLLCCKQPETEGDQNQPYMKCQRGRSEKLIPKRMIHDKQLEYNFSQDSAEYQPV